MREIPIQNWPKQIRQRYENYLKTSFFFMDPNLRASFQQALSDEGALLKGPFSERGREFRQGKQARALAEKIFPAKSDELKPALLDGSLYTHQERAVRATHIKQENIVVATGTASGKTESFLYPILFELYRQHLSGELSEPGVRALILYPMNALANDQRERLGNICKSLREAASKFAPTFGQYIGQTPEHAKDRWRHAASRIDERLEGELVLRDEMRQTPPHILLTNYSMLEYLLIRPDDSPLFDRGAWWQFIVLDEAHQYRGAKGMEMGMLIRRLKQRLRDGGRRSSFRCIATSATISSSSGAEDKKAVAQFAQELFGERFNPDGMIFSEFEEKEDHSPRRYHAFLRALEGAFLVHRDGKDGVALNRKSEEAGAQSLEIALCRECGQHYYVGREVGGKLQEAIRDPSHDKFGVDYYLPDKNGDQLLCRRCGSLSDDGAMPNCKCNASVSVKKCQTQGDRPDQLKECENCGYRRGGIGDPVQEIVHGSDGPNAVIATALHELLPEDRRRVLAFADSRQEAAFFAWYAEDSYEKLRDRNLILRAIRAGVVDSEGLSIDDLRNRLTSQWSEACLFRASDTKEARHRLILTSLLREALTDERRLSLGGVGLVKWFVALPENLQVPESMKELPWNFTEDDSRRFIGYSLDELRPRGAVNLPAGSESPPWRDVSSWPQKACGLGLPGGRHNVFEWGGRQSSIVDHFLRRILKDSDLTDNELRTASTELMRDIWFALESVPNEDESLLVRARANGTFRLNPRWLRVKLAEPNDTWECDTCATVTTHNIRYVCPRYRCPGTLALADQDRLARNHYRILYESANLPPVLKAEEHTAQIDSDEARSRQDKFKNGDIHLLSSSTTFEVGVDLGDLDIVFLRNVPPESFNYTQRVGRAGRREDSPGLALTYCRRNPHDLYHYEKPEERMVEGAVRPPALRMTNDKIILRHIAATAMSAFFRENRGRFKDVKAFIGDWENSSASADLRKFCTENEQLVKSLREIVPDDMHEATELLGNGWTDNIVGPESRLACVETEVCADYDDMVKLRQHYFDEQQDGRISQISKRIKTIAEERTLNFLSRKAVIPKYGFPVDVVELETHTRDHTPTSVALQRDLSQAIAEYAPGGKVVANKLEWESCGIKSVPGKAWPVRHYQYDDQHNFTKWNESEAPESVQCKKYLVPEFGFVTSLFAKPKEPRGRARRLYTTRPFFRGFDTEPETRTIRGVRLTKALPGELVILCEGKQREGFHICRSCGAHMAELKTPPHKSPTGSECRGMLERFSLGHELVTDVLRLQFPELHDQWDAYSVGYAVLLGAAETLNVPHTDLNVTITGGALTGEMAIVLYDNVPGGAGLVAQLEQERIFDAMLNSALSRVDEGCGCDSSCYGCLRSYRNQFTHPHLTRIRALEVLQATQ